MKEMIAVGAVILLILVGVIAFQTLGHAERYEYRVIAIPDYAFQPAMNAFGADGWELVNARRAMGGDESARTYSYEVILKRRFTFFPPTDEHSNHDEMLKIFGKPIPAQQ